MPYSSITGSATRLINSAIGKNAISSSPSVKTNQGVISEMDNKEATINVNSFLFSILTSPFELF